jgi:hypothetical protein
MKVGLWARSWRRRPEERCPSRPRWVRASDQPSTTMSHGWRRRPEERCPSRPRWVRAAGLERGGPGGPAEQGAQAAVLEVDAGVEGVALAAAGGRPEAGEREALAGEGEAVVGLGGERDGEHMHAAICVGSGEAAAVEAGLGVEEGFDERAGDRGAVADAGMRGVGGGDEEARDGVGHRGGDGLAGHHLDAAEAGVGGGDADGVAAVGLEDEGVVLASRALPRPGEHVGDQAALGELQRGGVADRARRGSGGAAGAQQGGGEDEGAGGGAGRARRAGWRSRGAQPQSSGQFIAVSGPPQKSSPQHIIWPGWHFGGSMPPSPPPIIMPPAA